MDFFLYTVYNLIIFVYDVNCESKRNQFEKQQQQQQKISSGYQISFPTDNLNIQTNMQYAI